MAAVPEDFAEFPFEVDTDPASPAASCDRCDAVCCRLTVVLMPEDRVPDHLTDYTPEGLHVMARDNEGWCVAVDAQRMQCSIYEDRPHICRRFVMDGPYCRATREEHQERMLRAIPLTLRN